MAWARSRKEQRATSGRWRRSPPVPRLVGSAQVSTTRIAALAARSSGVVAVDDALRWTALSVGARGPTIAAQGALATDAPRARRVVAATAGDEVLVFAWRGACVALAAASVRPLAFAFAEDAVVRAAVPAAERKAFLVLAPRRGRRQRFLAP